MDKSIDIKKQLEIKNKEIYKNKLNLDLDNNLDVLVLTIDNLLNFKSLETIKKIVEIEEGFQNQINIKARIEKFIYNYRINLMNLLDDKKNKIIDILLKEDELDNLKKIIEEDYLDIINKIEVFSKDNIILLEKELKEEIQNEFKRKRLNDYLNNIFINNLNEKVFDIIKNRDLILLNTWKETYLKYLELNKNTVGV